MGEAHFIGPKTVEVRSNDVPVRVFAGDQVFLDVGTHAAIPDVPGLKAAKPMTHVEALELDRLPEHYLRSTAQGLGFTTPRCRVSRHQVNAGRQGETSLRRYGQPPSHGLLFPYRIVEE